MKQHNFTHLFKLSAGQISTAFLQATRIASIEGIKLMKVRQTKESRFIIALTRGIKGSVKRNLLRRRIKGALRDGIAQHGPLPASILLCVVYPSATNRSYQEISSFLQTHLWQTIKAQ